MRTLILSIVCVYTTHLITAQQESPALSKLSTKETTSYILSPKTKNYNYLNAFKKDLNSSIVKDWKQRLANYNLKSNSIFDDSEKATYNISFKGNQANIEATFSNNGEILSTKERYLNIKLPLALRQKIALAYPGYAFIKNSYCFTYSIHQGISKQCYTIKISNGKQRKILKLDNNYNQI